MATIKEIKKAFKQKHDDISNRYYVTKDLSTPAFISQHEQCWKDLAEAIKTASDYIPPIPEEMPSIQLSLQLEGLDDRISQIEDRLNI